MGEEVEGDMVEGRRWRGELEREKRERNVCKVGVRGEK